MSEIILPVIPHATVTLNERNRVVITMDEGFVFYNTTHYSDLTDDEGNPRAPYQKPHPFTATVSTEKDRNSIHTARFEIYPCPRRLAGGQKAAHRRLIALFGPLD